MKNEVIKLNNNISINLPKLIDSRLLVQANSGGGKSWVLRRILEQSHGKVQQIILDPEGEFTTLREKHDYVLAGKGGDTPAEPRSAALLARKLLELQVSAIVDLYELHPQERKRFVRLFLEAMINAPKELWHPCMVVIDEAHTFVPEKGESEAADAVIGLTSLGRKRGFCAVLATQRISKLNKDAAAECNNKLIGRAGLDIDRKRAGEELGFTSKEEFLSIRTLKPGEFYAFGPAISDEVVQLTVGDVYTTHPKAGSRSLVKTIPPTAAVKKILGKLVDLPAEAQKEAQTAAELKAEINELRRHKCERGVDPEAIKRAVAEVTRQKDAELFRWQDEWLKQMDNWFRIIENIGKSMAEWRKEQARKPVKTYTKPAPTYVKPMQTYTKPMQKEGNVGITSEITRPEQRILNAIAWLESIGNTEPEQTAVAFLAGYTYGGGAFNNPKGALRTKGLVEYVGNSIKLTDAGRQQAEVPDSPLTTEALHGKVLSVLEVPHQKILKPLLERYPEAMSGQELAELSGYTHGAGAFNNPKGRLRSLGLIAYLPGGMIRARDILFI